MKTLIIIPTYNEAENLQPLLEAIFSFVATTDILIIDDNSPDGTGELADAIAAEDSRVRVLHRPGKLGLGTAYIAGFKYAIAHDYDAAFEMDADFSHDPRYLPDFLKAIEYTDLVVGSRYVRGGGTPNWPLMRRFISGGGNLFARLMLGIPIHECRAKLSLKRSPTSYVHVSASPPLRIPPRSLCKSRLKPRVALRKCLPLRRDRHQM